MSVIETTPPAAPEPVARRSGAAVAPGTPAGTPARAGRTVWPALAWGLVGLIAFIAVWHVATAFSSSAILREFAPARSVAGIADLAGTGVLWADILASLYRLLAGLAIAIVAGVSVGLAIGSLRQLDQATRPVLQFLRMISPLSWAPIAIAVFGIGDNPVVFLVAAGAVWPVILNTVQGVSTLNPGYRMVAESLGATRVEVFRHVVLPAVRPHILTGIRLALGIAWVVLVPAEMLGVTSGLGYEILNSRDQLAYHQVGGLIVVIGLLGFILDAAARRLLGGRG
ncbi:ABC transporter permease [Micrococcales bacterium 31B]|nr:ABC transporter permease [Micrococcales bacterium 31B]